MQRVAYALTLSVSSALSACTTSCATSDVAFVGGPNPATSSTTPSADGSSPTTVSYSDAIEATSGAAARARLAFDSGMRSLDAGNLQQARDEFAQAAELAPQMALAHLQLGIALSLLDPEGTSAQHALTRAVALAPENARAHLQLGMALLRAGRPGDAVMSLRRSIELRPTLPEAHFQLGVALGALGNSHEALSEYRIAMAFQPDHVGALNAAAELCEQLGNLDQAESALLNIVQIQPNVAYHRYRLAQFYERHGAPVKARQAFAQAEALDPRPRRQMRRLR